MTRSDLLEALHELGIPTSAYSLDGPGGGECYCLEAGAGGWITYYSERGQRNSVVTYATEQQANEMFLAELRAVFRA